MIYTYRHRDCPGCSYRASDLCCLSGWSLSYTSIYHIYRSQSSTSTAMPKGVVLSNMLFENPEIPERPAAEHPNVFKDMSIYMYI